jgi:pro-apoptotic serine protease NMA111
VHAQWWPRREPITRGTIQTQWKIKLFREYRRLGLTSEWESAIRERFPEETGTPMTEIAMPEGPSDTKIGDVFIEINGEMLTQFVRLLRP